MLLTWYFHREAQNNEELLDKLKERKHQILDHVMKTKTFNEAQEILAEFRPGYVKNIESINFRKKTPKGKQKEETNSINNSIFSTFFNYLFRRQQHDQPSNNFALICQKCSGHNGLVGKDQYENAAFQCCYCLHQNYPGKQVLPNKKAAPT
ncbi:endoplasmic reticulum junction formation protein lunapark-1-like [Centruroides sculpturatus]|uniref:endoplasmic reticulum junction formation protein lunapark-1-like n=1 Tax=Centruroides sculpturatus TaxID=218467 RepID=UPI000C6CDB46|nr:endoplasmic reticulum junction formation protein lunapark-1-like [Centruroides sculpturatus]